MAKKITTVLITNGKGAHVAAYLSALAEADSCARVVLVDPDGRWEREAKAKLGAKLVRTTRDVNSALKKHKPEMALVTLEAKIAPVQIEAALEAGCHVFAEKPGCVEPATFRKLKEKADSKHLHLMLALANRTNPEIEAARTIMQAGKIGRLFGVELHLVADQTRLARASYHQQWFADKRRSGGGHLIWLGIHWLDLAMYITGESIRDVSGMIQNVGGQPVNIEDAATMSLQFENGALGTMVSGYFLRSGYHSHIKIWGSDGWLELSPHGDPLLRWQTAQGDAAGKAQDVMMDRNPRGYTPFVAKAIEACADPDTPPPISNDDSLRALETVFAVYESAEKEQRVRVPGVG